MLNWSYSFGNGIMFRLVNSRMRFDLALKCTSENDSRPDFKFNVSAIRGLFVARICH